MADSNIHHFNGSFYYFGTHDSSPTQTGYRMYNWWVFESPDLVEWRLASEVWPNVSLPWSTAGERLECWATDAAYVRGKFYFYVSVGGSEVGVVTSGSAAGPWSDPLGKPLLSDALARTMDPPTTFRDPCIFVDDDGAHYIVSGVFQYYVARLGDDMISLAERPRHAPVVGQPLSGATGSSGVNETDDMPFMHKNNGLYYLSWGNFYSIGRSVYGPFVYAGSVIDTMKLAPSFRMNNSLAVGSQPGWQHGEDYTDRHGSFLHYGGQWFFSTNDRSHSSDLVHPKYRGGGVRGDGDSRGSFRDTVMCYIHYRSNGTMEPCVVNETGVGQYDARNRIEAENFFRATGRARKVDLRAAGGGDDFAVGMWSGAVLHFPRVGGVVTPRRCERCAAVSERRDLMLVRISVATPVTLVLRGGGEGRVELGRCNMQPTGGLDVFAEVSCTLQLKPTAFAASGEEEEYLSSLDVSVEPLELGRQTSASAEQELARLDWYTLTM